MKEYWTDENGVAHKILKDGDEYIVIDGDTTTYLEDEDVFDEEELEEMRREEEEEQDTWAPYHGLSYYECNPDWYTWRY